MLSWIWFARLADGDSWVGVTPGLPAFAEVDGVGAVVQALNEKSARQAEAAMMSTRFTAGRAIHVWERIAVKRVQQSTESVQSLEEISDPEELGIIT